MNHQRQAQVPEGFPDTAPEPVFQLGDRVRWKPRPSSDVGTVVGLQYVPTEASTWQQWAWKYLVWLDLDSDSRSWTTSDMAWEPDLERLVEADLPSLTRQEEV